MSTEAMPDFKINSNRNRDDQSDRDQTKGDGGAPSISGTGTNPWQSDHSTHDDPENLLEPSLGDPSYSKSAANSNPLLRSYRKAFED